MGEAPGRRVITTPDRDLLVLSSSLGMTVSTRPLAMLAADMLCPPTDMAADSMVAPGCRPSGSAGGGPPAQGRDLRQSGLRDCDRHEIARFRPLLDQLGDLRYVVFTVDALHCQRNHGTSLAECGAHCPTRHHLTTLPGPGRDWACCREDLRRRRRLCLYHRASPEGTRRCRERDRR